jgi:hypothetical protein
MRWVVKFPTSAEMCAFVFVNMGWTPFRWSYYVTARPLSRVLINSGLPWIASREAKPLLANRWYSVPSSIPRCLRSLWMICSSLLAKAIHLSQAYSTL